MADELSQLFPELANLFAAAEPTPPGPDPAAQAPDHGGVTDDDLTAFFAANPSIRSLPGLPPPNGAQPNGPLFSPGQTAPPPVGGVEDGSTFTPSSTSAPAAPAATPWDPSAQIPPAGTQTPPIIPSQVPAPPVPADAEIAQLRAIGNALKNDPQLRQIFAARMGGQPVGDGPAGPPTAPFQQQPQSFQQPTVPAPQQQVSTPPPDLDLEDPGIKYLYDLVQSTQQELHQQRDLLNDTNRHSVAAAEGQAQALYRTAAEGFQKRYELEASDVEHLSEVAARLGVLNTLASGTDPLTGLPVRNDPIAAIDRSLEIAYFTDPEYRQKEWERQAKVRRSDQQRKQKLSAVQGSSASAPRSQPASTTPEGMRSDMLGEVRSMMQGEWQEPVAN